MPDFLTRVVLIQGVWGTRKMVASIGKSVLSILLVSVMSKAEHELIMM